MNTTETKQMLFDKMWRGLKGQDWQQSIDERNDLCAYRGANGLKCAVGHCIPDDVYEPDMEGKGPTQLAEMFHRVIEAMPCLADEDISFFLTIAQNYHDIQNGDMEQRFRKLAADHGLTIPGEVSA